MTNEEIEAAREDIKRIWSSYFPTNTPWTIAAEKALDALCAAARQQESLAGRRVKGKNWPESNIGHIIDGPLFKVDFGFRDAILDRNDFELLEGDDAE